MEVPEKDGCWLYIPFLLLRKNRSKACLFLKDNLCTIQDVKPFQCRETPFVNEFFVDPVWRYEIMKKCPALCEMDEKKIPDVTPRSPHDRDHAYFTLLVEHRYNLERILGVVLPPPRLITAQEMR